MTQVDPKFGMIHDRETVVRATSLRDGDIDPSLPIQTISTGLTSPLSRCGGWTSSADSGEPGDFEGVSATVGRRQFFLFRDPGGRRSRCPPARPHAVLRG